MLAVLAQNNQALLAQAIQTHYAADSYALAAGQWLVVTTDAPKELCDKLGITDGKTASAVVVSFINYYGRASADIWEWLNTKMAAPNG